MKKMPVFAITLSLIVVFSVLAVQIPASAQRAQRTPAAPSGSMPTLPAMNTGGIQSTAYAAMTMSASTLSAMGGGIQATLDAASTQAAATLSALSTSIASTVEGGLTTTFTISEAMVNTAVSEALALVGYPGASVNLINGGMIITVPNFTLGEITGTLTITVGVSVANSVIELNVLAASVNGRSIPVTAVEPLVDTVEAALNALLLEASSAAVSIRIDALVVTETDITATITLDANLSGTPVGTLPPLPARTPRRGG